jgi:hypothetical protein
MSSLPDTSYQQILECFTSTQCWHFCSIPLKKFPTGLDTPLHFHRLYISAAGLKIGELQMKTGEKTNRWTFANQI